MRLADSSFPQILGKRISVQRSEPALFGKNAPSPPDNSQAGHDGYREIHADHSRNLAASKNSEQGGQGMQFDAAAHDARRADVVLQHSPDKQKKQKIPPVRV